ncbi:MAG: Acyl-CoA thioesterase [Pseudonocardiales bacterium]|nr:Acyl-CoA thioesterase [Pseudonocardiales bacterium]
MTEALELERVEDHVFRGMAKGSIPTRVYGGHLVAQALMACGRTVTDTRPVHSLHSYFLYPGDPDQPIEYRVEAMRDGRSLSTRQAVASQGGRDIFVLSASFHDPETGPAHQLPSSDGLDVDRMEDFSLLLAEDEQSARWYKTVQTLFPFEIRFAEAPVRLAVKRNERPAPRQRLLIRADLGGSDDLLTHVGAATFMSDAFLLSTSLFPHGRLFDEPGVQGSSLDHTIWFHREFRADDWLLYRMESTWAGGARALCTGHLFQRDGDLVATVMQEGLLRLKEPKAD